MLKQLLDIKKRLGESPELKPIYTGMLNFFTNNKKAKELAKERFEKSCKGCIHFINEPNTLLQIEDKQLPELSGKTCNDCDCVSAYKLRQSIKKCSEWQK